MVDPKVLHKGLEFRSEKQKSSQGNVFYVKVEKEGGQEAVLKIVSIALIYFLLYSTHKKSFDPTFLKDVFLKTLPPTISKVSRPAFTRYAGFPKIYSTKDGMDTSELLVEVNNSH